VAGQPLLDTNELSKRLDAVGWFVERTLARNQVISLLGGVSDLERLINRIRSEIAIPREVVSLRKSLETIPRLREILDAEKDPADLWLAQGRAQTAAGSRRPDSQFTRRGAVIHAGEGESIKPGFSEELDNFRMAAKNARQYLAGLENRERERQASSR